MVHVKLTDPMLNGDIYNYLAGMLPAKVREEHNVLMVDFTAGPSHVDEQVEAVKRITTAWQAAGHVDVGAQVMAA
jgi:hypothetical protein